MTSTNGLAVITGASSGIGLELARQFAKHGFDVVVCAEDAELDAAERDLQQHGTEVHALRVDLADRRGVEELAAFVHGLGRPVEALALNAGIGAGGAFAGDDEGSRVSSLDLELKMVDLNCRSTVHLAKLLLPDMVERGTGRVLITSSVASTAPGAYQAVYHATKSFDRAFAEGIRAELDGTGVTVTSLMPGPTDTEFFDRGELTDTKLGAMEGKDDPADVAQQGYEAMMAGKQQVVAGSLMNRVQARSGRFIPDAVKAKAFGQLTKPGTD